MKNGKGKFGDGKNPVLAFMNNDACCDQYNPVESVLQHYHDDAKQWAEEYPDATNMAQWYLCLVAMDLGFELETTEENKAITKAMFDEYDDEAKAIVKLVHDYLTGDRA